MTQLGARLKSSAKTLSEGIIQRRWFTLALYGVTAGILVPSIMDAAARGAVWLVAIDAFALGTLLASLAHVMLIPGLARGYGEIELATMKAQMEKGLHDAWTEFIKAHPEAREFMVPPTMTRQ